MIAIGSRPRLGLVVGPDRITAAVVRGGRVTDTFVITSVEQPGETLRAELDARNIKPRTARLALHRGLVTVKPLPLPAAAAGDVGQMVRFELERHVPFPADDAAFDFIRLPPSNGNLNVLVSAAERRVVERATQLLGESRIRPVAISVAALDLLPLLGRRPPGEHAVWVHRSGETVDLMFLVGSSPLLMRNVSAGEPADIVTEIRASLGLLRWTECDTLWISGDDADLTRASADLAALGIPPAAPPVARRARRALGDLDVEADGAALLAGAVAVGGRGPSLNLLPVTLRPRRLTGAQKVTVAAAVVTLALGVGALLAPVARDERTLGQIDAEIRSLDPQVRTLDRVMDQLERDRRLLETLQGIAAASLRPLSFLRDLTDLLPSDVWLTALTMDQKGAELTGQAAAASALIPLLENSPRLERVELVSPVTRGRDMEQFRIRGAWEAGGAAQAAAPPAAPAGPARSAPARVRPPAAPTAPASPDLPRMGEPPRGGETDRDREH
jgi:Tfp pilus assembly protein PilN